MKDRGAFIKWRRVCGRGHSVSRGVIGVPANQEELLADVIKPGFMAMIAMPEVRQVFGDRAG